jgi:anti-sigma factor ChrR (cupin superfamily)
MKHDVAELLPFYVNGTLEAPDRARVEAELARCPECSAELDDLRVLAENLRARAQATPPPPQTLLARTFAQLAPEPTLATRLRTAWWSAPARYATAVVLVASVSAGAVAAWHLRESAGHDDRFGAPSSLVYVTRSSAPHAEAAVPAVAAKSGPRTIGAVNASVAQTHRLARTATLELVVRDAEASRTRAADATTALGGVVTALIDEGPPAAGDVHQVHATIEVPAARLDDALDRLAQLGTVQRREIDAEDVDASLVDQDARLRNLRREETALLQLMDKRGSVDEILTVEQKLSEVRGSIEELDAQHQHDLHRVATGTISLTLTEDHPRAAPPNPGPTARIDGAWQNGLRALGETVVAFVSILAWSVAFSPVLLGLAGLTYLAKRGMGRLRPTQG